MNKVNKSVDNKKTSSFRDMFRSQIDTSTTKYCHRKPINRVEISPPILQHSTSIFSLVSPIRSNNLNRDDGLYKTQSPAPPTKSSRNYQQPFYHSLSTVIPSKRHESVMPTTTKTEHSKQDKFNRPKKGLTRRHSCSNLYIQPNTHTLCKLTERHFSYKIHADGMPKMAKKEKMRKMQELEDLITGRRGSTIRFTLTPKGLK